MMNWLEPTEIEKRQRKVILITFPPGAILLIVYAYSLFKDLDYLQGVSALSLGMELIVLFVLVYFRPNLLWLVELVFYYSFILFVFLIAVFSIEMAKLNPSTSPYILGATLSGLAM